MPAFPAVRFPGRTVQRTGEFQRILELPRRDPKVHEDLAGKLSRWLTRDHQCSPDCARFATGQVLALTPMQATALAEAHDNDGLFLQAPMGTGKTLLSGLFPAILEAKRPLVVVPSSLVGKTVDELTVLGEHWRIPKLVIQGYQKLSGAKWSEFFERYRPDVIILDEGHFVKNKRAAVARRLKRYVRGARKLGERVCVVDMSGTGIKRSLGDVAHRFELTHAGASPLPLHDGDLQMWCGAVDEKVRNPLDPGALRELLQKGEQDDYRSIRRAVGRRIFDTPGCVRSNLSGIDASLYLHLVDLPLSPEEDEAFQLLRKWRTPDKIPIADATALWRHARAAASGFYQHWDPPPPREWLERRCGWCADMREVLTRNQRGLDTELQVTQEVDDTGPKHPLYASLALWREIRPSYVRGVHWEMSVQWLGDTALRAAARWLDKHPRGIVWSERRAFGERFAELTGVPYFGAQCLDAKRRHIKDYDGPCVASIKSCGTGQNLQQWSEAWIALCWPTGTIWDQLLSRHHRLGQRADAVSFWHPISCREQLAGFDQACADVELHVDLLESPSRLHQADLDMPLFAHRGWAWREQEPPPKLDTLLGL